MSVALRVCVHLHTARARSLAPCALCGRASQDGGAAAAAEVPVTVQVGSHNWVDGAADHGVGWNVAWKRFPKLTSRATLLAGDGLGGALLTATNICRGGASRRRPNTKA